MIASISFSLSDNCLSYNISDGIHNPFSFCIIVPPFTFICARINSVAFKITFNIIFSKKNKALKKSILKLYFMPNLILVSSL